MLFYTAFLALPFRAPCLRYPVTALPRFFEALAGCLAISNSLTNHLHRFR